MNFINNKSFERDVPSMSKVYNLKSGKRFSTRFFKIFPFALSRGR